MKKVRYALGALGAVPAIGLMAPTANAVTAVTHAPRNATAGKTVSLKRSDTPLTTIVCSAHHRSGRYGVLYAEITYRERCVGFVYASIDGHVSGLSDRVRFYKRDGHFLTDRRLQQSFSEGRTTYASVVNVNGAYDVCQALVIKKTNNVIYGPVCLPT